MKHNVRRLFCALLAVLMLFSMAGFALADGGTVDIGGGIDGSFGDQPSTPSTRAKAARIPTRAARATSTWAP